MHDTDSAPAAPAEVHISSTGPAAELTVLERLEAFRELIRHGNALLGEVVSYCREAEAALTQLAQEKATLDQVRAELEHTQTRVQAESDAAHAAMAQAEAQRRELEVLRAEVLNARTEVDSFHQAQAQGVAALERSLAEAKAQQACVEQELQRARAQSDASRALESRLQQLDQMETKLRATERELADTRHALVEERSRRDRAIALIRPKTTTEVRA